LDVQYGNEVGNNERRGVSKWKRTECDRCARAETVALKVAARRINGELVNINAAPVRRAELQRRGEQDAAPRSNVNDPRSVARECGEESRIRPTVQASERKARGWMEPSAERLTWINHHHCVAWLSGVFTPRRSNHDSADAKDGELGAPGGRPLLCRNAPHRKFADPTEAEPAPRDRGESFKFVTQRRRRSLIRGGIWKPGADAHRG
jgi:hypothetical protein